MSELKLLYNYPQSPMTKLQQDALFACAMNASNPKFMEDVEKFGIHIWKMMIAQIQARDIKVADELKAFLILGLTPNPATLGLYLNCVAQIYKDVGEREVTLLDFNARFSEGYPNDITLTQAWDDAKAYSRQQEANS